MATPFSRTIRSLDADGFGPQIAGVALVGVLLAAWLAWLFLAAIPLYEISEAARLETDVAAHPVAALAEGRIVATHLVLGRDVKAEEVLVELDADAQRLQLEEERSRLAAIGPQLEALRAEQAAEERALGEERDASHASFDEARAKFQEAQALAQIAGQEANSATSLRAAGSLAELDLLRANAEAERRRAAAESQRLAVSRLEREQQTRESDRRVRIESRRREATQLEGQKSTTGATIERLQNEIERRLIRAPIAGRIGEVAELRVGSVVDEGTKLAAIVPAGQLRVVASFLPPAALGRVQPGQKARLRLEGFPWAEYGSLAASVESVGSEVRDGRVRVELAVHPDPSSPIPLQHGLPGTVEVEVERVSPAALVLRIAGRMMAGPGSAPASRATHAEGR
jgi:multidrug resistance efflux pump